MLPNEVGNLIKDETEVIAGLAFTGLYNNVVVFDTKCRHLVSKQFIQGGATINDTLRRVSYLRPSDPSANEHDRTYHFLHLTLQEYFAARYFFKKWTAAEVLKCLNLRNGKIKQIHPATFLQDHKYSARYDMVWCFIADLLSAAGSDDEEELSLFFNTIQQEPLDLLGMAHQWMIMHCLYEVHQFHSFTIRRRLEERLSKWLVLQCKMLKERRRSLGIHVVVSPVTPASEIEFPEQAIAEVLYTADDEVRITALKSLRKRSTISPRLMEILTSLLRAGISGRLAINVLSLFQHFYVRLPVDALNAMMLKLEDEDADWRAVAISTLSKQSSGPEGNLPEGILKRITARLEDQDAEVINEDLDALSTQPNLPQWIRERVEARLKDPTTTYEDAMIFRSNLRNGDLAKAAENQDPNIRSAANYEIMARSCTSPELSPYEISRIYPNKS